MKRFIDAKVCICPNCGALCKVGHDEDGQEFCAYCGESFKIEKEIEVKIDPNKKDIYRFHGWEAYYDKNNQ